MVRGLALVRPGLNVIVEFFLAYVSQSTCMFWSSWVFVGMKGGRGKRVCYSILFPWRDEVCLTVALGLMHFDASTGWDCVALPRCCVTSVRIHPGSIWERGGKIRVFVIDFVMWWVGVGGEVQHLRHPSNAIIAGRETTVFCTFWVIIAGCTFSSCVVCFMAFL